MPTKVYVGNLPDNTQADTLRDLFGGYGEIKELDIIKNFAFIHFDNDADANQAVKDLDNTKLLGQVITVQVSKSQKSKTGGSGDRNRRDDRRPPQNRKGASNNRQNGLPLVPLGGFGGLGGILGPAPGTAPLAAAGALANPLNILSAVNTLAAAAEQQRNNESKRLNREQERSSREQPDPDVRVRREVVHTKDVPNASRLGLSDGYVIYERYYVDSSHPLLKGLPLPDLPRMSDTSVSRERDYYRQPSETQRDNYRDYGDDYRDRSPFQEQDFERRDRDYNRADYYDRR